jgi:hypothetical protein
VVERIVDGIGVDGVNSIVPIWQAESSKPKNRCRNFVVMGIFIASGIAPISLINFGFLYRQEPLSAVDCRFHFQLFSSS